MDISKHIDDFLNHVRSTRAGTLLERADEFRQRLLRSAIAFAIIFGGAIVFSKQLFHILKMPLAASGIPGATNLHFTSPMEVFLCYVKVGFLAAATAIAPYAFYQVFRFVQPALPDRNRRAFIPLFAASLCLFFFGGAFCYFVIMPSALEYLLSAGAAVAKPMIMVDDYVSLLILMMLGFGATFQLPLVLIILERLQVISIDLLTKNRGAMLVAILIVAAIVTPTPDPFSQLAMAAPMYLLFEASILVMRWLGGQAIKE